MSQETGKSKLFEKMGRALVEAHEKVKGKEVELSKFGGLPGGIENGVAELDSMKFGQYGKGDYVGEFFFMAQGIVVSPEYAPNGQKVKGLRTKIGPLPVCATTNKRTNEVTTAEQNLQAIENEIKKFGVDLSKVPADQLENLVAQLAKQRLKFLFRTRESKPTEQYPNPRVWEEWLGVLKVVPNGQPSSPAQAYVQDSSPAPTADEIDPPAAKGTDLASLAKRATNNDQEAKDELTRLAVEAGHDEGDVESAESWDAVVEMINSPKSGDDSCPFEVGDMLVYTAPDPKDKTGKGRLKPVDVKVVSLDKEKETAELLGLKNNKKYPGVSWEFLDVAQS